MTDPWRGGMLLKIHHSSAAAGVVNTFVPGLVVRESCLWWLSYVYANFLVSPAACGLVLSVSLNPSSEEKKLTDGLFLRANMR